MSRLSKKLIIGITLIITMVNILCILSNNLLIEKYYLKIKRLELEKSYEKILQEGDLRDYQRQRRLEKENGILIVYTPLRDTVDELNIQLISSFQDRGLKLSKFWLWEEDYEKLLDQEQVNKIYNQKQLQYSVLVKFSPYEGGVLASAKMIPHLTEAIGIINQWLTLILVIGGVGMLLLISLLVRQMITPLAQLSKLTQKIGKLEFDQITLYTNDEIEDLSHHINQMSSQLAKAHQQLQDKNVQMKKLLSDMAHELKTPIALIKAYGAGIKDGLDDGTFLEIILEQNEEMGYKVEYLLNLGRIEHQEIKSELINLTLKLKQILDKYKLPLEKAGLIVQAKLQEDVYGIGDEEAMETIFTNLLTNAMKYTYDQSILITLYSTGEETIFSIKNKTNPETTLAMEQIWQPFYVGEASRNKTLSGTGLGLPIVKALLDRQDITYECVYKEEYFIFEIYIKNLMK